MPFPTQNLANDFVSWNVTYDIYSGLSGSCTLTNQAQQYSAGTLRWSPFQLDLTATVTSTSGADTTCMSGAVTWFKGLIISLNDDRNIDNDMVTVNLGSFFETLKQHPINSQYYSDTVGNIILDILNVYAGVPLALLNFSMAATPSVGTIVQGTDMLAECQKLAQAGESDMFVQVGGNLTIEAWKDDNSSVDTTIPDTCIISVKSSRSREKGPSRMVVRGRWSGSVGCGSKVLNNNKSETPSEIAKEKCYIPGVMETYSELAFKNLSAKKSDLKNAGYVLTGDSDFDEVTDIAQDGGSSTVAVRPDTGVSFAQGVKVVTAAKVFGRNLGKEETSDSGVSGKGQKEAITRHDQILAAMTHTPPGAFREADTDKTSDSSDNNRMEVTLSDADLLIEFGVVTQEVDNLYIGNPYTALAVAIREFKKFKMQRNTYAVETAYLPCIRLNDVVQFTTPDDARTITGRVANIRVNYTPDPFKTTMSLAVESFEELGGTLFASDNLFVYPELCGINGVNWIISSTDVYAISGYFAFENGGEVYQPLYLATGLTYTVTADLTLNTGPGSFEIRNYNASVLSGTSLPLIASGTITHNFSPTSTDVWVEFAATSGTWFMTNPRITTNITA